MLRCLRKLRTGRQWRRERQSKHFTRSSSREHFMIDMDGDLIDWIKRLIKMVRRLQSLRSRQCRIALPDKNCTKLSSKEHFMINMAEYLIRCRQFDSQDMYFIRKLIKLKLTTIRQKLILHQINLRRHRKHAVVIKYKRRKAESRLTLTLVTKWLRRHSEAQITCCLQSLSMKIKIKAKRRATSTT